MTVAYFDCFAGISGDMILGALVDAGLPLSDLKAELAKLRLQGFSLRAERVSRQGIFGTQVIVETEASGTERHLADLTGIVEGSTLSGHIKASCIRVFRDLAGIEARIHGQEIGQVHFHELGGIDTIVDVVGAVVGLERLGVERVYASKIHIGSGTVMTRHGLLPVPAPATAELLKGIPVYSTGIEAELATPTGAALIKHLASGFGAMPAMVVRALGYGAGSKDLPIANLLRLAVGRAEDSQVNDDASDRVVLLETNIDDMNPEFFDHVHEQLLKRGALDVFLTPVFMKKNRPATQLSVLAPAAVVDVVMNVIFSETTTIGIRHLEWQRRKLQREIAVVATPFGDIAVKVGRSNERVLTVAPEYDACKAAAQKHNVPLKVVYDKAKQAAMERFGI